MTIACENSHAAGLRPDRVTLKRETVLHQVIQQISKFARIRRNADLESIESDCFAS